MDEVDVQPVDLGGEVRDGVQPRLALAPVVLGRPVAREVLHERERHALRVVLDGLPLGKARRAEARPQVLEFRVGDLDLEGSDRRLARRAAGLHTGMPTGVKAWMRPHATTGRSPWENPGVDTGAIADEEAHA